MSKTKPFVVGIDPSLAGTGVTLDRVTSFTVKSRHATGDARVQLIYAKIKAEAMGADLVVLEDLPANAMSAGITGRAQGVVRLALLDLGVPYLALPAATIKKAATGKGNAKKGAMREALEPFIASGQAELKITDEDQVDAFWIRECGLSLLGFDSLLMTPEALDKYATAPSIQEVLARLGL